MHAPRRIPGLGARPRTDLPVLLAYRASTPGAPDDLAFSRWLVSRPALVAVAAFAALVSWPWLAWAQGNYGSGDALGALWRWLPFLVSKGFTLNLLISLLTMLIGTVAGVILGLWQISRSRVVRGIAWSITQAFRNSPWLVLLFIVMLSFPFQVVIGGHEYQIPDWTKAVFGLSLPVMANVSEIVRGAVQSVPTGQWEASESLAFTRRQQLWRIILPQCVKRMIPPWMNWYAILTMATPLVSLLGVEELVTLSRQAMEAENNHPELLLPFYGFAMVIFFAYCYPIARLTVRLERRFAVKM